MRIIIKCRNIGEILQLIRNLPKGQTTVNDTLTLTSLTWRIWWAPNNASSWQMEFNSAFKGLTFKDRASYV
jgi:hypothetical protein